MATRVDFSRLPVPQLQQMLAQAQACLASILTGGQEYHIGSRTFTRANIGEISTLVMDLQTSLDRATGTVQSMVVQAFPTPYADGNPFGWDNSPTPN